MLHTRVSATWTYPACFARLPAADAVCVRFSQIFVIFELFFSLVGRIFILCFTIRRARPARSERVGDHESSSHLACDFFHHRPSRGVSSSLSPSKRSSSPPRQPAQQLARTFRVPGRARRFGGFCKTAAKVCETSHGRRK